MVLSGNLLPPMRTRIRGVFERPSRSGIWWIDYHDAHGRRHREKVGPRKTAIEAYESRKQQIRDGKFFGIRGEQGPTFREIASERMERAKVRLRPDSMRTDRQRLRPLLAAFGDLPSAQISPRLIVPFMDAIVANGRSPATANRYLWLMRAIYSDAVRFERVAANPCSKVKNMKESAGRVRWLTLDEEAKLRAAISAVCPERIPEFELALHTGMRRGEQYGLKRAGVDLENRILTVSGKTGERRVHLNSAARSAVESLLRRNPDGSVVARREGGRWFEGCVKRAGIRHFRWHDLRHTFASRLVMAGADIRSVQELLGHKSIVMTMKYSHLSPDHQKANVERLVASSGVE